MSSLGILLPNSDTFIIVGDDDEHVGKIMVLDNKDLTVTVFDDIKSLMNDDDDWRSYATYRMLFTMKNGLVDTVSVSNSSGELL
nr:hypothetical protein [Tanacetum cinerariifolium]